LFTHNKEVILGTSSPSPIPQLRDLELQEGIYKLALYSDGKGRTLSFNSTTGELIT
jgi:hypothetical protein